MTAGGHRRCSHAQWMALLLVASASAGCLPGAATAESRDVWTLYGVFMAIAAVIGLLVYGLTAFAIVRYRRRPGDRLPHQRRGNAAIEATWTVIPMAIVAGLFAGTLVVLGRIDAARAPDAVEIRVEAFRWGWQFSYPSAGVTVSGTGDPGPEVVVPVGRPIRLTITSADVIHSFYVPLFLFKRDAVPGRENVYQFTVDEPGAYRGQCAEFCGIYHSRMPFTVSAVRSADFEAWLADNREAP